MGLHRLLSSANVGPYDESRTSDFRGSQPMRNSASYSYRPAAEIHTTLSIPSSLRRFANSTEWKYAPHFANVYLSTMDPVMGCSRLSRLSPPFGPRSIAIDATKTMRTEFVRAVFAVNANIGCSNLVKRNGPIGMTPRYISNPSKAIAVSMQAAMRARPPSVVVYLQSYI